MSSDINKPATINDLLSGHTQSLSEIYGHITQIITCQNRLRTALGPPLSDHLIVANLSQEILLLHTDSPVWASRLRFNIQNILKFVRQSAGLSNLKSVRIKVVLRNTDHKPERHMRLFSQNTAKLIEATTPSINDQRLRISLLNLVRHRVGP